ncbi:MAG: right-handed parallel beta-helix repeat-containing protein [Anaerohalosphaeraceae bacterium]
MAYDTTLYPAPAGSLSVPDANTITFSEAGISVGDAITTQYMNHGILFGGDNPFVADDTIGNPHTSPVLEGHNEGTHEGMIEAWFVTPQDPNTGDPNAFCTVNAFSLIAGHFDNIGSTRLEWFDALGGKMGERLNTLIGVEEFFIEDIGIARFRISKVYEDEEGFAIDNVRIEEPNALLLTKTDNTGGECQDIWTQFTYTISYLYPDDPNHTRQPLTGLRLIDTLPKGVDYMSSSPAGDYAVFYHTVTWELGIIYPGVPGSVTLTVMVNEQSNPGDDLINEVELCDSEGDVLLMATRRTPVCCWGDDVIYVDDDAPGYYHNGTSWEYAYMDLQDAIACVERGCVKDIWIARGTYYPGDDPTVSFKIPAGISVYGGFAGTETDPNQRDIKANPTILSGYIRTVNGIEERNEKVVIMGNNSLLDGITVEKGERGIVIEGANVSLRTDIIRENLYWGIRCFNGNLDLSDTIISNNGNDGVYHSGLSYQIYIKNCIVYENKQNGVNCQHSMPTIVNSLIHHNGIDGDTYNPYYGIRLFQPNSRPVLRNNTIVCNTSAGIYYVDNSYGTLPKPQVKNCIVWHNAEDEGFVDIQGLNDIAHSCLTNPNNVYGINPQTDARGNLYSNPVFAYSDLNLCNFHLAYNSPCKDMGDPNETATTEADIDDQARIAGNSVEIGADEVDCEDVYNSLDWDADGLVNLKEFEAFSAAWLTYDPNHPNLPNPIDPNAILHWNPMCDLDSDLDVDMADLITWISDNWLWSACWKYNISAMQQQAPAMMTQSYTLLSESLSITSTNAQTMKAESADLSEEANLTQSLINQIDCLIEVDQENADTWQEMTSLLEQSLLEIEKTRIKTAEF